MIKIIFAAIITSIIFISNDEVITDGDSTIVGLWQVNTPKVADALHDSYKFYRDGSFEFDFDQYDDMKRILSISGKYTIGGDWIRFTVLIRKELVDGIVVRGSPAFQKGWILIDAKQVTVNEQYSEEAAFEICDSLESHPQCIKIDNEKFYKLSDNPDDPAFR